MMKAATKHLPEKFLKPDTRQRLHFFLGVSDEEILHFFDVPIVRGYRRHWNQHFG